MKTVADKRSFINKRILDFDPILSRITISERIDVLDFLVELVRFSARWNVRVDNFMLPPSVYPKLKRF